MQTEEQDVAALINALPDDVRRKEIKYLHVLERIRAGLAEIEAGQGIPHEEVKASLSR